jgi:uncharacterized membrane protein YidH (DUF202 family)
MITTITFISASVGIAVLVLLKHFEMKAGRTFFHSIRFKADTFIARTGLLIHRHVPTIGKKISKHVAHHTAYHTSSIVLMIVQFMERRLLRLVNLIKGKGVVKKNGSASFFLKHISEHKKNSDREKI